MELLTPDIGLVAWSTIAFLIVLLILKKFAWGPIVAALDEREQSIAGALESAEKARQEMAALTAKNEEILLQAKEERTGILKEANKVKEQIIAEAKEKAQADAAKILAAAKEDIEVQRKAVIAEMKNTAAALSLEIAEKVLAKELSDKGAQEKFVNELADKASLN
jgi:F-type H+-transporting ATPase subunit b